LAWVERAGYQDIEDIEPITVAAYIETLQRRAAQAWAHVFSRVSGVNDFFFRGGSTVSAAHAYLGSLTRLRGLLFSQAAAGDQKRLKFRKPGSGRASYLLEYRRSHLWKWRWIVAWFLSVCLAIVAGLWLLFRSQSSRQLP
jgi:hypothetical protein